MGLSRAALRFLVREHRRKPLRGSVLTLGRQCVYASHTQVLDICRQEGIEPVELPAGFDPITNIPAWHGTPHERNASDAALFRLLGADDVLAMDYSDFEGAEIVHDLNKAVPDELESRFDVIVDSGTIEHIFDVRSVFTNIGRMLKSGGRIIHFAPANNYANHGFYQISPTLLIDYYAVNGYVDLQAFVAEESSREYEASAWELFQIDTQRQPVLMLSRRRLHAVLVAEKSEGSTVEKVPLQSHYANLFDSAAATDVENSREKTRKTLQQRIKDLLPAGLKHVMRRWLLRDAHRKPWGTRRVGKLR